MTNERSTAEVACEITLNGLRRACVAGSLTELLDELGHDRDRGGIAVALNGAVVPRRGWDTTRLSHGDHVDVVGAVQGG
jgi:sulfur carrier protein